MKNKLSIFKTNVHIVEKEMEEGKINQKRLNAAKSSFNNIRKYLSDDEINWAKNVLFENCVDIYTEILQNDELKPIFERRSIRQYKGKIQKDDFEKIVNAARYAPSSCNRQPISFILTEDKLKISRISNLKKQGFIKKSPNCIIACSEIEIYGKDKNKNYFIYMDAGAAIQNLLIAGHNLNIGMCWVHIKIKDIAKIREIFMIPSNVLPVAIIACGTIDKGRHINIPGRKKIKDMIKYERWISL